MSNIHKNFTAKTTFEWRCIQLWLWIFAERTSLAGTSFTSDQGPESTGLGDGVTREEIDAVSATQRLYLFLLWTLSFTSSASRNFTTANGVFHLLEACSLKWKRTAVEEYSLQSTLALRTPRYCGHSLLRTKSRSPAKEVWLEMTPAITDSRYNGH